MKKSELKLTIKNIIKESQSLHIVKNQYGEFDCKNDKGTTVRSFKTQEKANEYLRNAGKRNDLRKSEKDFNENIKDIIKSIIKEEMLNENNNSSMWLIKTSIDKLDDSVEGYLTNPMADKSKLIKLKSNWEKAKTPLANIRSLY